MSEEYVTEKYRNEEYLTDEELAALIADVESGDVQAAPSDLLDSILERVEKENVGTTATELLKKESEFHPGIAKPPRRNTILQYRIRVVGAMAAALLMIFLVPELMTSQAWQHPTVNLPEKKTENTVETLPKRETIVTVKTREEVLEKKTIFDSLPFKFLEENGEIK